MEGAFGRVVDPFVDKVLVIGSFIFFAGKNFIVPAGPGKYVVDTITGIAPWMVVVILARELLVTSFRGLGEGTGQNFGAAFSGKVKMVVQSVTILVVLVYVNYFVPQVDKRRVQAVFHVLSQLLRLDDGDRHRLQRIGVRAAGGCGLSTVECEQ